MDTQTKTGLAIAAALIAAFFMGGIAFTFAGGVVRALSPMHDGAPFAASAVRAYDHGPMMDEYGRFGATEFPRSMEHGECGDVQPGPRREGMRFVPPCEQDGEKTPYEGECPVKSGI